MARAQKRNPIHNVGDKVVVIKATILDVSRGVSDKGIFGVVTAVSEENEYMYTVQFDTPLAILDVTIASRKYTEEQIDIYDDAYNRDLIDMESTLYRLLYREVSLCDSYNNLYDALLSEPSTTQRRVYRQKMQSYRNDIADIRTRIKSELKKLLTEDDE